MQLLKAKIKVAPSTKEDFLFCRNEQAAGAAASFAGFLAILSGSSNPMSLMICLLLIGSVLCFLVGVAVYQTIAQNVHIEAIKDYDFYKTTIKLSQKPAIYFGLVGGLFALIRLQSSFVGIQVCLDFISGTYFEWSELVGFSAVVVVCGFNLKHFEGKFLQAFSDDNDVSQRQTSHAT